MKTVKEALEDGTLGLEDEIDYADMTEEEFKQEIERLKKRIEDLNTINEEHKILNGMIRKELQQKENIIKEVREFIYKCNDGKQGINYSGCSKLLEILDKVD